MRSGLSATALAIAGVLALGASSALASGPPASPSADQAARASAPQQVLWQHACEDAAKGTVSPQAALVCVHFGFPEWGDGARTVLQRVCEQALGGTYVRRSEFPVELAACFFD